MTRPQIDPRDPTAPAVARATAPALPPRETWGRAWREAWRERWCIAEEGGAADPGAVADLDLRVAVLRGDVVDESEADGRSRRVS